MQIFIVGICGNHLTDWSHHTPSAAWKLHFRPYLSTFDLHVDASNLNISVAILHKLSLQIFVEARLWVNNLHRMQTCPDVRMFVCVYVCPVCVCVFWLDDNIHSTNEAYRMPSVVIAYAHDVPCQWQHTEKQLSCLHCDRGLECFALFGDSFFFIWSIFFPSFALSLSPCRFLYLRRSVLLALHLTISLSPIFCLKLHLWTERRPNCCCWH